jgi:hypothetical protein
VVFLGVVGGAIYWGHSCYIAGEEQAKRTFLALHYLTPERLERLCGPPTADFTGRWVYGDGVREMHYRWDNGKYRGSVMFRFLGQEPSSRNLGAYFDDEEGPRIGPSSAVSGPLDYQMTVDTMPCIASDTASVAGIVGDFRGLGGYHPGPGPPLRSVDLFGPRVILADTLQELQEPQSAEPTATDSMPDIGPPTGVDSPTSVGASGDAGSLGGVGDGGGGYGGGGYGGSSGFAVAPPIIVPCTGHRYDPCNLIDLADLANDITLGRIDHLERQFTGQKFVFVKLPAKYTDAQGAVRDEALNQVFRLEIRTISWLTEEIMEAQDAAARSRWREFDTTQERERMWRVASGEGKRTAELWQQAIHTPYVTYIQSASTPRGNDGGGQPVAQSGTGEAAGPSSSPSVQPVIQLNTGAAFQQLITVHNSGWGSVGAP